MTVNARNDGYSAQQGDGTVREAIFVSVPSGVTLPVSMPVGAGVGLSASATFTPAATSHVAGDCFGAAGTFALAAPSGGRIKINSVSLEIDGGTIETTAWILYLYSVTPPSATADDGAWDLPSGDRASFLGKVDIAQVVDLGSTLWVEAHNIGKQIKLAGTSVFGYLVNGTTLTPQAVAHIVTINAEIV